MNMVGKVCELFISTKGSSSRTSKQSLTIDALGVLEDKFHNTDVDRSVLITSLSSYALVTEKNISITHGSLGENLLIDYNPYALKPGTRLKIGNTLLEISQYCTICNHLSKIDKTLPELLKHDRGIFAKVVQAGEINVEDEIYLI